MSTLMSSRVKPRFKMASTADSAATLLLKSPVTNFSFSFFAFSLSAIQSSHQLSSLAAQTATLVPTVARDRRGKLLCKFENTIHRCCLGFEQYPLRILQISSA